MAEGPAGKSKNADRKAREERLAAALRVNLRRRKAAAKGGKDSVGAPPAEPAKAVDREPK